MIPEGEKNRSAVIVYKVLHRLVDERRSPSWLPTSTAALCMGQAGVTCGGRQQLHPCVPRRAPSVALYAPTRPTHPAFDRSARTPATEQQRKIKSRAGQARPLPIQIQIQIQIQINSVTTSGRHPPAQNKAVVPAVNGSVSKAGRDGFAGTSSAWMALAEARMDAVFAAPRKPIPARQTQNSAEPTLYAVAVAGAGQSPALRGVRGSSPAYQNPLTSA